MARKKKEGNAAQLSDGGGFDMTPMIDVTFLLIIFFMLVTDITNRKPEIDLPIAKKAEEDRPEEDPGRLVLSIHKDGRIAWVYGILSEAKLHEVLKGEALTSVRNGLPDRAIMIRADSSVEFGEIQKLMVACMKYKLWRISFSTKDVQ